MQLKLDKRPEGILLTVAEGVNDKDAEILRVGLRKLLMTEKDKTLVVDLSTIPSIDAAILDKIKTYRGIAAEHSSQLFFVAKDDGLNDASTVEEAFKLGTSELGQLLNREAQLKERMKTLEAQKEQLEKELEELQKGDDIVAIRHETASLTRISKRLEEMIRDLVKLRKKEPSKTEAVATKMNDVVSVLDKVLQQEKIIS